jgi:16S rRNA U516 pseudouridylate synthase RsuA-like enzyme
VNGQIGGLGDRADLETDTVAVDGIPCADRKHTPIYMLNKPGDTLPPFQTNAAERRSPSWWRNCGTGCGPWAGWIWIPRACCF